MNSSGDDHTDEGESRLRHYLEELREDPPASDPRMTEGIVRRARWQGAVRGPLQVVGTLFAAVAEGLSALLGAERRPRR
jgi:hypothetical protein